MFILKYMDLSIHAAAMVPFFPDYAEKFLNADSTVVGVIFSLYPLSLFLTSLVAGMASARFGRVSVYTTGQGRGRKENCGLCPAGLFVLYNSSIISLAYPTVMATIHTGLFLLGGGTVGFGFCADLKSILIMRVVQVRR